MEEPSPASQVERCIQVGLSVSTEALSRRPAMSTVLLILDGENPVLPQPKQPDFYTLRNGDDMDPTEDAWQQTIWLCLQSLVANQHSIMVWKDIDLII